MAMGSQSALGATNRGRRVLSSAACVQRKCLYSSSGSNMLLDSMHSFIAEHDFSFIIVQLLVDLCTKLSEHTTALTKLSVSNQLASYSNTRLCPGFTCLSKNLRISNFSNAFFDGDLAKVTIQHL